MKEKFLWLFLFFNYYVFSQTVISGTLRNEFNEVVVDASVTITNIETERIIAYSISDSVGKFHTSFTQEGENIQINVRSMSYAQITETIENKTQVRDFVLQEQHFELKEVVVKPPPITRRGDTINYSVSAFSNEQDRSIADVLRRMPGIEVLNSGQILYEGTPINRYYIEGLDLLEGKYSLANENLPHKEVAKVQILENHQPIRILDSLVFSDRAALNIQLKNKHTFTGQAKVGTGFSPLLWDINVTPMLFSKNRQMLSSYQTNNTGDNIASQIKPFIMEEFARNTEKQDWLAIQQLMPPDFLEKRWLDNNTHLFSTNVLQKLKKEYELRLNISYLNDYQQQEGYTQTLFFTPTDTISLFESKYNRLFYSSLETNLTLQKNTKKNYFKNNLQFQGFWDGQNGNIIIEKKPLTQKLSNQYFNLSNNLNAVFPIGKQLIILNSYIGLNYTPQTLQVNPGQFEEVLNEGISYEEVVQNIDLKTFYTNNSTGLTKGWGYFTFSPKIGFQLEVQTLESDILIDGNQDLKNEFTNRLEWQRSRIYFHIQNQYKKGKWQISLNTPVNFHSYEIKDFPLQERQTLNRFTFEPRLSINYEINTYWKASGSMGLSNTFGTINQMHYAYILQNYRTLQRINSPLPEILNKNVTGGIFYRNPIKTLFGNLMYSFNQSENNLLYENYILPNGAKEIRAIMRNNNRKNHNLSGRISKYFSEIKTSLTLNANYGIQEFQIFLNSTLTDIQNKNQQLGAKIETDITSWFNMEYQTSLVFSYNKVQNQQNRNNQQQSHQLNLNFYPAKQHYIGVKTEYVKNNLFSNNAENLFSDMLYRYTLKNKNIDLELHCTNILNVTDYRTLSITEYSYLETSYRLRPSQILFRVRFSI